MKEIAIPKRGRESGRAGFDSGGLPPTCAGIGREGLGLESSCATPVCPRDTANPMAVSPIRFGILASTLSRSTSNFTTPSCPLPAAHKSGVRSYKASVALGSMSFCPSTNFTARPVFRSPREWCSIREGVWY